LLVEAYEPPNGAAGALSEQTTTIDLLFEQMAAVSASLDRVTITGMEMSLNNDSARIVRQNNGCWYLVRQNLVVLNMSLD